MCHMKNLRPLSKGIRVDNPSIKNWRSIYTRVSLRAITHCQCDWTLNKRVMCKNLSSLLARQWNWFGFGSPTFIPILEEVRSNPKLFRRDDSNDCIFDIFQRISRNEIAQICIWRDRSPTFRIILEEVSLVLETSWWDNSDIFLAYV